MPKDDLRGVVQRKLKKIHWQRIDIDGLPNLNGCIDGREFWLHCMVSTDFRARASPSLLRWICARSAVTGAVFILVARVSLLGPKKGLLEGDGWLITGSYAKELKRGGLKKLPRKAVLGVWTGRAKSWDWGEIGEVLCGYPGVD